MELGNTLLKLRQKKGIYQKELAIMLHLSIGTISNYEKNVHAPDLDTLCRLADFYGVTTDYMLGRTKYPYDTRIFNSLICKDFTVCDFLKLLQKLPPKSLCCLIRLMQSLLPE